MRPNIAAVIDQTMRSMESPSRMTAQIWLCRAGTTRETLAATSGISLHSCASEKLHIDTLLMRSGSMREPPEEQFSMTMPGTAASSLSSHERLSSATCRPASPRLSAPSQPMP